MKEEKKAEKEAEKHGSHSTTGGTSTVSSSNPTTHSITGSTHTPSTANVNPTPAGVPNASGGLGQNTMKSDYNSTPTDGPFTTHGRHAEREAAIGSGGVEVPHRPRDSEFGSTTSGTGASGLGGVGNGSNITGPNTHVHGISSNTRTSEAGIAGHNARDALSSHPNTTSGLGGATSMPSTTHEASNIEKHSNIHHGSNAALGSGAVGAAGLAEHEHRKHGNTGIPSNNQTYGHTEGSHGTHNSAALNAADPRVDSDLDGNRLPNMTSSGYGTKDAYGTTTGCSGNHLGRDAAAIGTAGAVGEGIHHHNHQHSQGVFGSSNGPHTTATANRLDPNLNDSKIHTEGAHTHHGHGRQSEGRVEGGGAEEADGVHGSKGTSAGAGVVPVGAYEAGHGRNTTTGPHSSNLATTADPRVDSDLSKQQNHHYGRDAAIAGGAGGAAYEANKHHGSNTTAGPHSSNIENKIDPRVDSDRSRDGHHYGRDAALAGGAAGTAYEVDKHHGTATKDQKPIGKDIGDRLHGVERNRGVNGPTGFPHESGHSVPTGAIGSGEPGLPRGNVQDSHNTHGHNKSNSVEHPVHNSTGPDHIFTAPVMNDPAANPDLREGKIDQHDHQHGVSGVARDFGDDHTYSTGGGHEHSKSRGLEHEINSAPLGNTSTTPGSGLRDHTHYTSSGTTALNHGSGLTGHNTTTGSSGLNHGSGLGHDSTSRATGLNDGYGSTGTHTHGLPSESHLGQNEYGNTSTTSRAL